MAKTEEPLILENIGYAFIDLDNDEYIYMNPTKIFYTYDSRLDEPINSYHDNTIDNAGIIWTAFDKILEKINMARNTLAGITVNKTAGIEYNGRLYATIKLPCHDIILITNKGILATGVGSDYGWNLSDDEADPITHSWKKFDEMIKLIDQYRKANVKQVKK